MRQLLFCSLLVVGSAYPLQTTQVSTLRPTEQSIVINIQEPQPAPPSPGNSKVKIAWIAAGSAIISAIITASVTLGVTLSKCGG